MTARSVPGRPGTGRPAGTGRGPLGWRRPGPATVRGLIALAGSATAGAVAVAAIRRARDIAARTGRFAGTVAPEPDETVELTVRSVVITTPDGVSIEALVVEPAAARPTRLVVLPSSYGLSRRGYRRPARRLAATGRYSVIAFSSRGFGADNGLVDVADRLAVQDVSTVVDWADRHTLAAGTTERVGVCGLSYGAGLALLAAATDPRIAVIAAMSGWADLAACLNPNGTVSARAIDLLLLLGKVSGRPGPELARIEAAYREDRLADLVDEFAAERSVRDKVADFAGRQVAVQLIHNYQDSYFPPSQIVDFFEALDGPKRLLLGPGDHASDELTGLLGLGNAPWDACRDWFDAHLDPERIPLPDGHLVRAEIANQDHTLTADTVAALADSQWTGFLGPAVDGTGELSGAPRTGWRQEIVAGTSTIAGSGVPLAAGAVQAGIGAPPLTSLRLVNRDHGAVWESEPFPKPVVLVGRPRLRITLGASAAEATVLAYLYDVPPNLLARLVTHKPFTVRDLRPGEERQVEFDLEFCAWRLARGHRLALVIDTQDVRYRSVADKGTRIVFASPEGSPSQLGMPVRGEPEPAS